MFKSWFIVQFQPNAHMVAERNLRIQAFETFLPMEEVTKRKGLRFSNELATFLSRLYVCLAWETKKSLMAFHQQHFRGSQS